MLNNIDNQNQVAFDAKSLNNLKNSARENSAEAIKGVAKEFEAIFMNMMLKSMRDATMQDSPFENEQTKMFTAMLDQQLSTNLSNKGLGLAEILAKQLSKNGFSDSNSIEKTTPTSTNSTLNHSSKSIENSDLIANRFKVEMQSHAKDASKMSGIPLEIMIGQAALETGWGKYQITHADGTSSFNLFGIKANNNWSGKVVEATTTEYINGVKQKRIEKFRAYDSYAESFQDFANLIKNNPRYHNVIANLDNINQFALAMKQAGYATDPEYAKKLTSVIQKVVNS